MDTSDEPQLGHITAEEALELEYPYWRLYVKKSNITKSIEHDKNYVLNLEYKVYWIANMYRTVCGQVVISSPYMGYSAASNYYTGHVRVRCRRKYEMNQVVSTSPFDYWQVKENRIRIITELQAGKGADKPLYLSDIEYKIYSKVKGCGTFTSYLLSGFVRHYGAKSVLDFSSGWGDRLFGAIASEVRYVGVDPNPDLHGPYAEIIADHAKDPSRYTMIQSPFQTAVLPEETFDLVFTSPPYFDLEIYVSQIRAPEAYASNIHVTRRAPGAYTSAASSVADQSTVGDTSLDDWKTNFLYPSLIKAWGVLNVGGHMCLNINDHMKMLPNGKLVRVAYTDDMIRFIRTLPGSMYQDMISQSAKSMKSPQPFWIWKKIEPKPILKQLIYHRTYSEITAVVKWGQLKLLCATLQALATYWDRKLHPKLIVVYAGAAHGQNIGIISKLLGSSIEWHLYDKGDFRIKEIPGVIHIYKEFYTNKLADKWAAYPNVFFLSDIRVSNIPDHVAADMLIQMEWVRRTRPYLTSLKFRLPFPNRGVDSDGNPISTQAVEGQITNVITKEYPQTTYLEYLSGDIMIQPYNGLASTETRLMIKHPGTNAPYLTTTYNCNSFESDMFYHNMVTRKAQEYKLETDELTSKDMKVLKSLGLINDYDSFRFIKCVSDAIRTFDLDVTIVDTVKMILDILGSARAKPTTLNSLRRMAELEKK